MSDKVPDPLSPDEAKRKIDLFLDQGRFRVSAHCRDESMPKRNVTSPDIVNCLKTGSVIRPPQWDDRFQNWKYEVEGIDLDDEILRAITVIFDQNLTLLVLTVF